MIAIHNKLIPAPSSEIPILLTSKPEKGQGRQRSA
jgi:hypothetical protein